MSFNLVLKRRALNGEVQSLDIDSPWETLETLTSPFELPLTGVFVPRGSRACYADPKFFFFDRYTTGLRQGLGTMQVLISGSPQEETGTRFLSERFVLMVRVSYGGEA